jgi:hypothetical protein
MRVCDWVTIAYNVLRSVLYVFLLYLLSLFAMTNAVFEYTVLYVINSMSDDL